MPHDIHDAVRELRKARKIVVFTGAGISAESGIPTFRDNDGFWREFPPEEFATWTGLVRIGLFHPKRLAEFVTAVLAPVAFALPNHAHRAVARLAESKDVTVVTQNIDRLHHDAGNQRVLEIHGSLFEIRTQRGRPVRTLARSDLAQMVSGLKRAPRSWWPLATTLRAIRPMMSIGLRGVLRPDVVLFDEPLPQAAWAAATDAAERCDAMLCIGTSGQVLPAAMLPAQVRARSKPVIDVGPEESGLPSDIGLRGRATEIVPTLVDLAVGPA